LTDRQVLQKVEDFKSLVQELGISSINDIPTLDDLTEKFKNGTATVKDSWFAKIYSQGLKIQQGAINAPEMGDLKQLALDMQKRFPSQRQTKAGTGAIANQIRLMKKVFEKQGVTNSLTQLYSTDLFKKGFDNQRSNIKSLTTAVDNVSAGLGLKKQVTSKILKSIPTDEMIKKVLRGIVDIPDQETKRLVLLGLFGTRGAQVNDLVSDRILADDVERPYYDRKLGIMMGDIDITEGRKGLADKVPFGPFMKDVMDYQYDIATNNGKNLNTSLFSKKVNLGTVINKYLFNKNGVSVLSDAEIATLGRQVNGFTDLRRMILSWSAETLGDKNLASELLTHGSEADLDKSVTGRFYIPGKGTDITKLRAFVTGMEQNIARALGYNNYQKLIEGLDVESYTTEISKVKNFGKRVTIVEPESKIVQGNVRQPNLVEQGTDPDIDRQLANVKNQEEIIKATKNINEQIKALMVNEGLDEEQARIKLGLDQDRKPKISKRGSDLISHVLNNIKNQTREAVGDISQTIDEGVDRITSKETYSEAAERLLDPEEWKRAGKQILPLASQFVPKPLKLVGKAGKMLMPSTRLEGSAEVAMEAGDEATRSFREEQKAIIEARKMQEQMGNIEQSMLQNESLIGDKQVEETEEQRINRQMMEAGFGA
jgi:hypothetical protein